LQIANGVTIEKDILREGQNWWRWKNEKTIFMESWSDW
jgi:hypothetical protein